MYNNGDAATLHIENAQIPLFQAKIQELLPSLHSRLRFSQLRLPLAVVTGTDRPPTAVNGPAAAVLRMYGPLPTVTHPFLLAAFHSKFIGDCSTLRVSRSLNHFR